MITSQSIQDASRHLFGAGLIVRMEEWVSGGIDGQKVYHYNSSGNGKS